jgi:hypothetical protein
MVDIAASASPKASIAAVSIAMANEIAAEGVGRIMEGATDLLAMLPDNAVERYGNIRAQRLQDYIMKMKTSADRQAAEGLEMMITGAGTMVG